MSDAADMRWRRSNLGHLLFAATGFSVGDALHVVHAGGFPAVTEAQLALLDALKPDGARLTTLAARAGVAKQSMIEIVDRAADQGLVSRSPDPLDARAKLVLITPVGGGAIRLIAQGRQLAHRRLAEAIGATRLQAVTDSLIAYAAPTNDRADAIDRIMGDGARRFVQKVLEGIRRRGYQAVTEAQLALYRTLELDGSRLTDVAARARITKQSMLALVQQAAALGLVDSVADAADGRARIIRFTSAGRAMLGEFRSEVEAAEIGFAAVTGEQCLAEVKAALTDYLRSGAAAAPALTDSAR